MIETQGLEQTILGKKVDYKTQYDPTLLHPIARQVSRDELQIGQSRPFNGIDIWNAYEVSWLTPRGMPQIAVAEFYVNENTLYLIESKSFKLYLNSLNQTSFENIGLVKTTLEKDLSRATQGSVAVKLLTHEQFSRQKIQEFPGICLDQQNISMDNYQLNPDFLRTEQTSVAEEVYSHLFRANCPVTNQPDWAGILIRYTGKKIQHEGLLKYLISYRETFEFAEQCTERVFIDIWRRCAPEKLSVYMRFTRRGGLDINPFRSSFETQFENLHLFRQ